MTIANTLHCLRVMVDEENCENCPCYGETGTDHCEKDAVRVAIASLEAWDEIKQEINDLFRKPACYMPNYDAYMMFLAMIDKHLQEVKSNE